MKHLVVDLELYFVVYVVGINLVVYFVIYLVVELVIYFVVYFVIHSECGSAQFPAVSNMAGAMPKRGNQPAPVW